MAKSPLYDNERSQTESDRKDEAKGEDAAVEKKAKDSADESKGMDKYERGEDEGLKAAMDGLGTLMEGIKKLHKAHEAERRDAHGNHREALRQMSGRHEKQFKELVDGFKGSDNKGEDVTGTEAAAAADTAMEGA